MKQYKSPFFVEQEFVSPLLAEEIVDLLNFTEPTKDKDENPVMTFKTSEPAELILCERLLDYIPTLEEYYGFTYKGTERPTFEWYPPATSGRVRCENSDYIDRKWARMRNYDFTGILFLSDYQDRPGLDEEYEVYGGKLEMPNHKFSFNPQRGTLVIFPSEMHFLNATAPVMLGNLYQVRFQITATAPYIYDPEKFPGDYTKWFADSI